MHIAEFAGRGDLEGPLDPGQEPAPDGLHQEEPPFTRHGHNLAGFPCIDGERLFTQDMLAGVQRREHDPVVLGVRSGNVDHINRVIGEEPLVAGDAVVVPVRPFKTVGCGEASAVSRPRELTA